jgi:DNA polymerase I-like protein with 3'-5' exonuclease and polymerase domains
MAKRGGHATNYYGTPRTVARHLKVEERVIADFQASYFGAFPGIREYHHWVAREIGLHQCLVTPLGRRRHFFGRPGDDATLREAIAFLPQSVVGDLLNTILWKFWKELTEIQLLAQVHDSIVFQYREGTEDTILPMALALAKLPIHFAGQEIIIPADVKIGWNWAESEIKTSRGRIIKNPDGLIKWKEGTQDGRRRATGLDRVIS